MTEKEYEALKKEYSALKKEDLVTLTINKTKDLASLVKTKDDAINNEFTVRKELEALQANSNIVREQHKTVVANLQKEIAGLKQTLTGLANLFDECATSYKELIAMLRIFSKNNVLAEAVMQSKIDAFNNANMKQTEKETDK